MNHPSHSSHLLTAGLFTTLCSRSSCGLAAAPSLHGTTLFCTSDNIVQVLYIVVQTRNPLVPVLSFLGSSLLNGENINMLGIVYNSFIRSDAGHCTAVNILRRICNVSEACLSMGNSTRTLQPELVIAK